MSVTDQLESLPPRAGPSTAEQVAHAFQIVLRRSVEEDGVATYGGLIDSGSWTILDVVDDLLKSAEYALLRPPVELNPPEPDPDREPEPEPSDAERAGLVDAMYRTVLGREADPSGLARHVPQLASGESGAAQMLTELLDSDEYALRFPLRRNVALQLARTLIVGLTGRDPGEQAVDSYANAVSNGYPLSDFIAELMASPEVALRMPTPAPAQAGPAIPVELAVLAQELIAAELTAQGGVIALPPMATTGSPPVSTHQMALLIRTLAMLATVRA